MSYYPDFAALLSSHLVRANDRSASWLARKLGVHPSTVNYWQNGRSRPKDPETIVRIADILGIHEPSDRYELLNAAGYGYQERPHNIDGVSLTTQPLTDVEVDQRNRDNMEAEPKRPVCYRDEEDRNAKRIPSENLSSFSLAHWERLITWWIILSIIRCTLIAQLYVYHVGGLATRPGSFCPYSGYVGNRLNLSKISKTKNFTCSIFAHNQQVWPMSV